MLLLLWPSRLEHPSDHQDITDTDTFRKRLKSVHFDRAYHWLLLALLDVSYSGTLQILRWLIDWLNSCLHHHGRWQHFELHDEWHFSIQAYSECYLPHLRHLFRPPCGVVRWDGLVYVHPVSVLFLLQSVRCTRRGSVPLVDVVVLWSHLRAELSVWRRHHMQTWPRLQVAVDRPTTRLSLLNCSQQLAIFELIFGHERMRSIWHFRSVCLFQ